MLKFILFLAGIAGIGLTGSLEAKPRVLNETLEVEPEPEDGFHWPFLLHIPHEKPNPTLMVVPNNNGKVDNNHQVFVDDARRYMYRDGAYLAEQLNMPILMPIFPRPQGDPRLYTHALNRRALEIKGGKLERLDLQLIAMIRKARTILHERNIKVPEKFNMFGLSASAMFTNRFALMHPHLIRKAAFGSPGGWPIAPHAQWTNRTLRYPIGIADLKTLTGKPFDGTGFKNMEIFYFLGSSDLNDSVLFRDSFDREDEDIIREWGTIPVDRWETSLDMYKKAGCKCTFKLYEGLGHEMNGKVWRDVVDFFKTGK